MARWLLLFLAGTALILAMGAGRSAAMTPDVTLTGTLANGGTVSITLDESQNGILRASIRGGSFPVPPPGQGLNFSGTTYFVPPVPITDGHFETAISDTSPLTVGTAVSLTGDVAGDGNITGHATLIGCTPGNCPFDIAETTWSAQDIVSTPPGAADRVVHGTIAAGGSIEVATNTAGDVTAFELVDFNIDGCFTGETLSLRAFYDVPVTIVERAAVIRATDLGELRVNVTVEGDTNGAATGRLSMAAGPYIGDCVIETTWSQPSPTPRFPTVVTVTPTLVVGPPFPFVTVTSTPPPALPESGSGPAGNSFAVSAFALTAAGTALVVGAYVATTRTKEQG